MKQRFTLLPILTVLTALTSAIAQQAHTSAGHTATPAAATAVAQQQVLRKAVAPALYEIAYSAKQNAVFVAAAGGRDKDAPPPRIFRLNPDTLAVEVEIALERPGLGLHLDDEANRLYVGNAFHASVTVLDTATNSVQHIVQLAQKVQAKDFEGKVTERYPHNLRELVLDKRHKRLFAPGIWINDSVLYVMNTETMALEKVIPDLGFGAAGVTLDERAGKLYVSNMQGQLFRVGAGSLAVEQVSEVAADQLLNLSFDTKKQKVLATDHGAANPNMVREKFAKLDYKIRGDGNRVVVIDPAGGQVLQSIPTGTGPVALLVDAQRDRLWVTNRGTGTVTVHDSQDYRLLQTFRLQGAPNSLALDRASGAVFVTIKQGESDPKGGAEGVARLAF